MLSSWGINALERKYNNSWGNLVVDAIRSGSGIQPFRTRPSGLG
jgi:hypothetical protein